MVIMQSPFNGMASDPQKQTAEELAELNLLFRKFLDTTQRRSAVFDAQPNGSMQAGGRPQQEPEDERFENRSRGGRIGARALSLKESMESYGEEGYASQFIYNKTLDFASGGVKKLANKFGRKYNLNFDTSISGDQLPMEDARRSGYDERKKLRDLRREMLDEEVQEREQRRSQKEPENTSPYTGYDWGQDSANQSASSEKADYNKEQQETTRKARASARPSQETTGAIAGRLERDTQVLTGDNRDSSGFGIGSDSGTLFEDVTEIRRSVKSIEDLFIETELDKMEREKESGLARPDDNISVNGIDEEALSMFGAKIEKSGEETFLNKASQYAQLIDASDEVLAAGGLLKGVMGKLFGKGKGGGVADAIGGCCCGGGAPSVFGTDSDKAPKGKKGARMGKIGAIANSPWAGRAMKGGAVLAGGMSIANGLSNGEGATQAIVSGGATTAGSLAGGAIGGALIGRMLGGVLGTMAGPIGTAIGMTAGGFIGSEVGDVVDVMFNKFKSKEQRERDRDERVKGNDVKGNNFTNTGNYNNSSGDATELLYNGEPFLPAATHGSGAIPLASARNTAATNVAAGVAKETPDVSAALDAVSSEFGMPRERALVIAHQESSLKPDAKAGNMLGLYQFSPETWKGTLKYAQGSEKNAAILKKYGITGNPSERLNPTKSAIMFGLLSESDKKGLRGSSTGNETLDNYTTHFLGQGTGKKVIDAINSGRGGESIRSIVGDKAYNNNLPSMTDSKGRDLTASEFMGSMKAKTSDKEVKLRETPKDIPTPYLNANYSPATVKVSDKSSEKGLGLRTLEAIDKKDKAVEVAQRKIITAGLPTGGGGNMGMSPRGMSNGNSGSSSKTPRPSRNADSVLTQAMVQDFNTAL